MDTNEIDSGGEPDAAPARNWKKSWIATGALAAGLAIGAAGVAGAATGSGSSSSSDTSGAASSAPAAPGDGQAPTGQPPSGSQDGSRPDPASMPNGPGETVLTGDDATKAKAAALEAVPGATVIRVETDSSGEAKYEAHLTKSDGTQVTVLMDENFKVTATEDGFGRGPQGQNGGQPPQGGPQGGPGYGGATTSN